MVSLQMDKSWIKLGDTLHPEYLKGIQAFLEFAYLHIPEKQKIYCPCKVCRNRFVYSRDDVTEHLIMKGMWKNYTNWTFHGESYISPSQRQNDINESRNDLNDRDDMIGMVQDGMGVPNIDASVSNEQSCASDNSRGPNGETIKFFKLLEDAESELYPECKKFSKLSFIVRLLHIKVLCGWSDKSFTILLELLLEAFPEGVRLPPNYYEANKITDDLGFKCETFDACPNNCMLYRKEYKDKVCDKCKICQTPRFKIFEDKSEKGERQIAAKQVRYFPLKPRLQKFFMCSKTSALMRWHADDRVKDGKQRHPADSLAWKAFDERNHSFASDPRNVRLGLATDGFNPFRSMNITHSTWPVILIPYNLPPWLCMKQSYFMLSVLIDGPKSAGDKIDVYLQPLIEELQELWDPGVQTYDASNKEMFSMKAALMWTISDFPAYANLSGWSTKGRFACPPCNKETRSLWLSNGKKFSYIGHRRWLHGEHIFRKDANGFDGHQEMELKPNLLSGVEVLEQLESEGILTVYKFDDLKKRKMDEAEKRNDWANREHNWKKKSIFFELPYWRYNLIRHCLDVMHIEKNVCDNIIWTLLGLVGKSKDNLKARNDLKEMGIRRSLHPQIRGKNKTYLPPACFTMSKKDKEIFCEVLMKTKYPDGYASNISKCVNMKDCNISGLKSHDNHILMQHLLPLAIRRVLPKNVVNVIIELSNFFRQLCSKVNSLNDVEKIQDRIALTLCHLEKIFPPAFFDIMEHLPIHLADEALVAGIVLFRWMYPIERYMLTLKRYVRNRAHPEGSISKGYLMEECMNFCERYLVDVETRSNRPNRNYDGDDKMGRPISKKFDLVDLNEITYKQAHRWILFNIIDIQPFRNEHLAFLKNRKPRANEGQLQKLHNKTFCKWFEDNAINLNLSDKLQALARGPSNKARSFGGYIINGFRFRKKKNDKKRITQNCGVVLNCEGSDDFYGVLTEILEIRYTNDLKYVLFRCDWIDNQVGKKQDEFNFTMVNFKNLLYKSNLLTDEPFILAYQAKQFWYVKDPVEQNWHVVMKMVPRDLFDEYSEMLQVDSICSVDLDQQSIVDCDGEDWVRGEVEGTTVDTMFDVEDDDEMDDS